MFILLDNSQDGGQVFCGQFSSAADIANELQFYTRNRNHWACRYDMSVLNTDTNNEIDLYDFMDMLDKDEV